LILNTSRKICKPNGKQWTTLHTVTLLQSTQSTLPWFFCKLLNRSNCIHHLLPPPRDTEITSRLRKTASYPRPRNY